MTKKRAKNYKTNKTFGICVFTFVFVFCPILSHSMNNEVSLKAGFVSPLVSEPFNAYASLMDEQDLKLRDSSIKTIFGIHFIKGAANLLVFPRWYFFENGYFDIGLLFLYHFNCFYDLAFEHDLFYGLAFRVGSASTMGYEIDISLMQKYTSIHSISASVPFLLNNGLALKIKLNRLILQKLLASFSIASYDEFYYPLFLFPIYTLELEYKLNDAWKLAGQLAVSYTDQFTLTSYMNIIAFKMALSYKIVKE